MSIKLLLPAAGRAVRMGGLLKELLPLGLRPGQSGYSTLPAPVLAWTFRIALHAGVETAVVVTSSSKASTLMEVITSLELPVPVCYLHQPEPTGLGDAAACAAPLVADGDIALLLMPDTVLWPPDAVVESVRAVVGGALACAVLFRVDRPQHFGAACFDADGRINGFMDKPAVPLSHWVWTAVAFRAGFFSYLARSKEEGRPPDFTSALDLAARDGVLEVRCSEAGSYWDVGTYEGYISALQTFAGNGLDRELLGAEAELDP
jgi:dTDP-glucose pyrophosphorylase